MSIIVKGGGGKPEEKRTVTAGTSTKVVIPSDGKTIKKVTVNPTPTEEKTIIPTTSQQIISPSDGKHIASVIVASIADGGGVVPKYNRDAETINPGTEDIIIPTGTYLRGDLTIAGDSDLIPENIKDGVNIFGVDGTPGVSGKNVWAKYECTPEVIVTNPSLTMKFSTSTTDVKISNENFDLTRVSDWKNFFIGFKANGNAIYKDSLYPNLYIDWSYSGQTFKLNSFNPSEKKFTVASTPNINVTATFVYSGEKTFPLIKGDVIKYVVNDDVSAYPNGAVHTDGYYYELLGQVTSANVMSLSDDALAAVQSDYRDTIVQEVSES